MKDKKKDWYPNAFAEIAMESPDRSGRLTNPNGSLSREGQRVLWEAEEKKTLGIADVVLELRGIKRVLVELTEVMRTK